MKETREVERSLDPEDWEAFRALAHRMVDDMVDQTRGLRDQAAWQPPPSDVKREIRSESLPLDGQGAEQVYEDFLKLVQPYTTGNRHPRAWGWVRGNGSPLAAMAEMLAAAMNAHLGGGEQSPTFVEERCLQWLAEVMEMPAAATGILVSGGTMANLLGLAVARDARAGFDVRREGLADHARLTVYASSETHMWARKSMDVLGMGARQLREIPVDEDFRIDLTALREQIGKDRDAGLRPIAVIGNAGTVNSGAVDDLPGLAALCREENLWFHVDGAFGALLKLSDQYAPLVRGVELADSLAFDLHKWMYLPFEIGCLLVADGAAHRAAFSSTASYLEGNTRGMLATGLIFSDRGVELTRSFKALKLWMTLKAFGLRAIAAQIEQNMEQAQFLERRVGEEPELELVTPRRMNIVCFRYRGRGVRGEEYCNALNRELVIRLQESGEFVVSGTELRGRYVLRIANTNHRSRRQDFEDLAQATLRIGRELEATTA
jgi:glutamate/tyrosine decarboxylase-like PLP-dependent enzyme